METNIISKSVEITEELKKHSPLGILESIFPEDEKQKLDSVGKTYLSFLEKMRELLQEAKEKDVPVVIYFSFDPKKIECLCGIGHAYVCKVIHVGKAFFKIKKLAICGSTIDEEYRKKEIPPEIFSYVDTNKFLHKVSLM